MTQKVLVLSVHNVGQKPRSVKTKKTNHIKGDPKGISEKMGTPELRNGAGRGQGMENEGGGTEVEERKNRVTGKGERKGKKE